MNNKESRNRVSSIKNQVSSIKRSSLIKLKNKHAPVKEYLQMGEHRK